jgi:hypothetical protein
MTVKTCSGVGSSRFSVLIEARAQKRLSVTYAWAEPLSVMTVYKPLKRERQTLALGVSISLTSRSRWLPEFPERAGRALICQAVLSRSPSTLTQLSAINIDLWAMVFPLQNIPDALDHFATKRPRCAVLRGHSERASKFEQLIVC